MSKPGAPAAEKHFQEKALQEKPLTVLEILVHLRGAADEYDIASLYYANMLMPAPFAGQHRALVEQAARQSLALREAGAILEALSRLPAATQLALGLLVLGAAVSGVAA